MRKSDYPKRAAFFVLLVAFYTMLAVSVAEKPIKRGELYWCDVLAEKYHAEQEVQLDSRARCDLVNGEYAIEVDWAKKKFEAIGQSLYYAMGLKKKPAIILLVADREHDQKHVDICREVCEKYGIQLFEEDAGG